MIAILALKGGTWSLAEIDPSEPWTFQWWCGESHGWVSPSSSHWDLFSDCWNETFPTHGKALAFARRKGWIK